MSAKEYIDLIIYLSTDWKYSSSVAKGYYFGGVPFIRALSKLPGVRILCVNQPFTPMETTIKKKAKAVNWIKGRRLEKLGDNLFLYTPFAFIHEMLAIYSPLLQRLNNAVLSKQIRKQLDELGFNSPIRVSWIYHPLQYNYLWFVNESFKIYNCWDLYSAGDYPIKVKQSILLYEKKLISNSDIMFTPCTKLFEKLFPLNRNTFFIPGGVNIHEFNPAANWMLPTPKEFTALRRPIIGFAGVITKRVDMSLIRFLAELHPEWSIVMIGNIDEGNVFESEDFRRCQMLPNVYFLGFKEFEMLPSYIKLFDVCMLPHSDVEVMKYAHPYKTLQYLALGKPVVSTNFPDAYYYKEVIRIARNHKEFAVYIEEALNDRSEDAVKSRIDFAKENTWDIRVKETYDILRKLTRR